MKFIKYFLFATFLFVGSAYGTNYFHQIVNATKHYSQVFMHKFSQVPKVLWSAFYKKDSTTKKSSQEKNLSPKESDITNRRITTLLNHLLPVRNAQIEINKTHAPNDDITNEAAEICNIFLRDKITLYHAKHYICFDKEELFDATGQKVATIFFDKKIDNCLIVARLINNTNQMIGFCIVTCNAYTKECFVNYLHISSDQRRNGNGKPLLAYTVQVAFKLGYTKFKGDAYPFNIKKEQDFTLLNDKLIGFYKEFGATEQKNSTTSLEYTLNVLL